MPPIDLGNHSLRGAGNLRIYEEALPHLLIDMGGVRGCCFHLLGGRVRGPRAAGPRIWGLAAWERHQHGQAQSSHLFLFP